MPAHQIDTAVVIDLLRGYASARNWIDNLSDDDRLISVMTAAELLDGCKNAREQRQLERELKNFTILSITEAISLQALDWYRAHRLSVACGFADCIIGATAFHLGLTLCTLNIKHFRIFEGLRVERPY